MDRLYMAVEIIYRCMDGIYMAVEITYRCMDRIYRQTGIVDGQTGSALWVDRRQISIDT